MGDTSKPVKYSPTGKNYDDVTAKIKELFPDLGARYKVKESHCEKERSIQFGGVSQRGRKIS